MTDKNKSNNSDSQDNGGNVDGISKALSSTLEFTKRFFKCPPDYVDPWKPFPFQENMYNYLDYGYDPEIGYKPKKKIRYIVFKSPRQFGKTTWIASAAAGLALRISNVTIGIISIKEERAKELLKDVIKFIKNSIFADQIVEKKVNMIRLENDSVIESNPTSSKIAGTRYTWLFVDEVDKLDTSRFDMENDAFPTTRVAGAYRRWKTPDIILSSTPMQISGRFYDYYTRGLEQRDVVCKNCGNRRHIQHRDFSKCEKLERGIKNPPKCPDCGNNEYYYIPNEIWVKCPNPWNHPFFTKEEIQSELDIRGNTPRARAELLAEFIADDSGVFFRDWIVQCANKNLYNDVRPKKNIRYCIGGDFGVKYDASVYCAGHRDPKTRKIILDHMYRMPGGDLTYDRVRYKLLTYVKLYNPDFLVLDSTGIGNPVVERIEKDIRLLKTQGISGKYKRNGKYLSYNINPDYNIHTQLYCNKNPKKQLGFYFDYQSKIDLVKNLVVLFQQGLIEIPPEFQDETIKTLWKELIKFNYEYTTGSNRIKYGTQNEHDDTVIALALMAWGLKETPWYSPTPTFGGKENFILPKSESGDLSWDAQI